MNIRKQTIIAYCIYFALTVGSVVMLSLVSHTPPHQVEASPPSPQPSPTSPPSSKPSPQPSPTKPTSPQKQQTVTSTVPQPERTVIRDVPVPGPTVTYTYVVPAPTAHNEPINAGATDPSSPTPTCKSLKAATPPLTYAQVEAKWISLGSPKTWDPDGNGYPCEDQYGYQNTGNVADKAPVAPPTSSQPPPQSPIPPASYPPPPLPPANGSFG